jgi:hypothetical protein
MSSPTPDARSIANKSSHTFRGVPQSIQPSKSRQSQESGVSRFQRRTNQFYALNTLFATDIVASVRLASSYTNPNMTAVVAGTAHDAGRSLSQRREAISALVMPAIFARNDSYVADNILAKPAPSRGDSGTRTFPIPSPLARCLGWSLIGSVAAMRDNFRSRPELCRCDEKGSGHGLNNCIRMPSRCRWVFGSLGI